MPRLMPPSRLVPFVLGASLAICTLASPYLAQTCVAVGQDPVHPGMKNGTSQASAYAMHDHAVAPGSAHLSNMDAVILIREGTCSPSLVPAVQTFPRNIPKK